MRPYSMDLRKRVLAAVDAGKQDRLEIARVFSVSVAWIRRLVQRRRETGSIEPLRQRHGPQPKLDEGIENSCAPWCERIPMPPWLSCVTDSRLVSV